MVSATQLLALIKTEGCKGCVLSVNLSESFRQAVSQNEGRPDPELQALILHKNKAVTMVLASIFIFIDFGSKIKVKRNRG
jgi:hypothetical protein